MFKNPLKYQQGGQLNEQQQQILAAFIDWLPKRVKEFQGMKPEAIVQALDGMSKTPEGQKQVQQLMEQFQQESQSGQSFKRGGKVQDFICKHAKGGVAGCGCEKPVLKGQEAIPGGMPRFQAPTNYYNEKGWPISERDAVRRNNRTFYTEEPTTAGNLAWTNNQMSSQLMWPGIIQDVKYNQPVGHYIDEYGNMHNFAIEGDDLTRYNNRKAQWKENGGKVAKAQFGISGLPVNPNVIRLVYDKVDNFLTPANKWEEEHGTKVVGGIGLPAYVAPQSTVIDASKLLYHRIPNQKAYRKETEALIKAIKENTVPELKMSEPSVFDYDIDRGFSNFNNNINVPDFSKAKLTNSWWDMNGEGLLWALPSVGIPATLLGQEIVNKHKNKNKNSGGGSR